ncbi:MAG: hypothetical protein ACRCZ2_10660 [Fusobacteriaceae bacterium]
MSQKKNDDVLVEVVIDNKMNNHYLNNEDYSTNVNQIQNRINNYNPIQVSEKLSSQQKKNQLLAENIIYEVDIPRVSKEIEDINCSLVSLEYEINDTESIITSIRSGILTNPNEADLGVIKQLEIMNNIKKTLTDERSSLKTQKEKLTDKYYKLRQSVKEPTINIATFNMENTNDIFAKFKIKRDKES